MSNLISTFQIRFDNETKADIDALKAKIDELTRALSVKNDSHGDRLLAAMQAEAANDAPQPEFKYLGQWVFAGVDDKYQSAAMDKDGKVYLYECELNDLNKNTDNGHCYWWPSAGISYIYVCTMRDGSNWEHYAIQRETVNDVDYLSGNDLDECGATIQGVEACYTIWQTESVPQITQADMQLIFIKNLSETLIQRMHSMDRFSDDDYAIGGNKLMAWDILIYEPLDAYAVLMRGPDQINVADLLLIRDGGPMADAGWNTTSEAFAILRTITEAELPAFRATLEACYA